METQNHSLSKKKKPYKTHLKRSKILVVKHLPSMCEIFRFNPYYHPKKRKREKRKKKEKGGGRWLIKICE